MIKFEQIKTQANQQPTCGGPMVFVGCSLVVIEKNLGWFWSGFRMVPVQYSDCSSSSGEYLRWYQGGLDLFKDYSQGGSVVFPNCSYVSIKVFQRVLEVVLDCSWDSLRAVLGCSYSGRVLPPKQCLVDDGLNLIENLNRNRLSFFKKNCCCECFSFKIFISN